MSNAAVSIPAEPDANIRGNVYWLLSLVFKYPSADVFAAHQRGDLLGALGESLSRVPHLEGPSRDVRRVERQLGSHLKGLGFEDFQVAYTRTFDVGAPEPPCPPYEGIYRHGAERTAVLLEVSEFYKHFGLAMNREEGKRELPDHLSAELEFLHFLTFKEAQARQEGTDELLQGYLLAQKDFQHLHLLQWLPPFCARLQKAAFDPLYAELAGVTHEVVRRDHAWLCSQQGPGPGA